MSNENSYVKMWEQDIIIPTYPVREGKVPAQYL